MISKASKKDKFEKGKKRERRTKPEDDDGNANEEKDTPLKKRRKTSEDTEASPAKADKAKKDFNPVGSVIGRKRKARKLKKS